MQGSDSRKAAAGRRLGGGALPADALPRLGRRMELPCWPCTGWPLPPTGTTSSLRSCANGSGSSSPTSAATAARPRRLTATAGVRWHPTPSACSTCWASRRLSCLGHSWGGNVAVGAAAHFPGRVRALVTDRRRLRRSRRWYRAAPGKTSAEGLRRATCRATRAGFLARIRGQLEVCWNSEVERIVQTMVVGARRADHTTYCVPGSHAQILRAMWDDPSSGLLAAHPLPER